MYAIINNVKHHPITDIKIMNENSIKDFIDFI